MEKIIKIPIQCAHRLPCINYNKGLWISNIFGINNDYACNYPSTQKPIDSYATCSNPMEFPSYCPLSSIK